MTSKTLPLTPQERAVVDEAYQPFLQALVIIAKLRGLNPAAAQLTADRTAFVVAVPDETPTLESNGIQTFG